jgi:diaminopimelate epimerase
MCGNGARCFAAFARRCGVVTGRDTFTFDTVAGAVSAQLMDDGLVAVGLTEPHGYACFPRGLGGVSELGALHYVDTGVPHVVAFVHDVAAVDVTGIGSIIRRYGAELVLMVFTLSTRVQLRRTAATGHQR